MKQLWSDLKRAEVLLVAILSSWNIVADLLPQIGLPVRIVTAIAAVLSIVALVLQNAVTAGSGGTVATFLVGITTGWSVIAANLGEVGVPVKVITSAGAGLALLALIAQKTMLQSMAMAKAAKSVPPKSVRVSSKRS